jgi:sugar phosphate isomerase/epimerase
MWAIRPGKSNSAGGINKMLYISTSSIKANRISTAIEELVAAGFRNIELSGGTKYYEGWDTDIVRLQQKHQLNLLCHNYFPPPKTDFVLNIASLNDEVFQNSIDHIKGVIDFSKKINSKKYAFHAGFYMNPQTAHLGKSIPKLVLADKDKAVKRFFEGYQTVSDLAGDLILYIENNVISSTNYANYGANPFMLTTFDEYLELQQIAPFQLLLDVAHLKVSCTTLGLDFKSQFKKLSDVTDYIHVSDNDGLHDQNLGFSKNSDLYKIMSETDLKTKTVTLEVYDNINTIKHCAELLEKL